MTLKDNYYNGPIEKKISHAFILLSQKYFQTKSLHAKTWRLITKNQSILFNIGLWCVAQIWFYNLHTLRKFFHSIFCAHCRNYNYIFTSFPIGWSSHAIICCKL